jgi:hypothetical protein
MQGLTWLCACCVCALQFTAVDARRRGDTAGAEVEADWSPAEYAWAGAKLLFAFSPLLAVGYVAFFSNDSAHEEARKRKAPKPKG